ncbi:alpha/beta hydrolase-fold protein [uncultured Microbulbifer sp.]|uniref:alpha/beta hydrolase n=1 Tax=uncultured Microbulbifer sp. TaxID=348147 RepID=UPI002622F82E|nr:alpha/beta hydrolase-fold protein [uncultured Microbulbifer sp.]
MTDEIHTPLDYLPALKGDYFRLDSRHVGRPYHIYVRFPEKYEQSAEKQYPVIYLLDGDSLFPILAANHIFLHYDDKIPEAIVVGIAYGGFDPSVNWRDADFSTETTRWNRSGGAENFHQFLQQELLPTVEERYRTDPTRRVLYGQSRGGFMVLYSAFNHPDLFWGRISGNPSLHPNKEQFFAEPAKAERDDLMLIVSSATEDRYRENRELAREWHEHWADRPGAPWSIRFNSIEGGTHAASSPEIYRYAMRQLFQREIEMARRASMAATDVH